MRLKSVKLSHFRGYRTTIVIPIDEAMIGQLVLPGVGLAASLWTATFVSHA
jgi:hypothetical protein